MFAAMRRENNKFFKKKIIKNYIDIITERLINVFNDFLKKFKQIDMHVFEAHEY